MQVSTLMRPRKRYVSTFRHRVKSLIGARTLAEVAFVTAVTVSGAKLSMFGKGAWIANSFMKIFWRGLFKVL